MGAFQEYLRVLRLHVRMQFSLSSLGGKTRRSGKDTAKAIGLGVLILYGVGAILLFYSLILFPFLRGANALGLAVPLMGIIVMLCMLIVLIFGTLTLLSIVFGARDAEFFASVPLREQSVFAAKLTMAYLNELFVSALFLLPAAVIYGIVTQMTAPLFILLMVRAIPVWLLLPTVPMALAALLSMLFTRLTAFSRHRDTFLMIGGMVLTLGLVVGQSMLSSRMGSFISDPENVMKLLADNSAMLEAVTRSFPPAAWCAQALVGTGAAGAGAGFAGMLAAFVLGLAVCLLLSRRLYYKGVLAQLEAPRGKKRGFSKDAVKTGSAFWAYVAKEGRTIIRSPIYAINILIGVIIFPLMIAILSFGSNLRPSAATEQLAALVDMLRGLSDGGILMLVSAGFVMLMSVMSMSVSTTFSREGGMLWISQTVPVPVKTQVAARLFFGFLLTAAGALASLGVLIAFLGFTAGEALFGLVAGLCAAFPILAASIIPDAVRPKRKWNSEAEAIKQNFNSIFAMLIALGIAAALGFAAFGLQKLMPVWAVGIVISLGSLVAGYALFLYAVRLSDNMLRTVDG